MKWLLPIIVLSTIGSVLLWGIMTTIIEFYKTNKERKLLKSQLIDKKLLQSHQSLSTSYKNESVYSAPTYRPEWFLIAGRQMLLTPTYFRYLRNKKATP